MRFLDPRCSLPSVAPGPCAVQGRTNAACAWMRRSGPLALFYLWLRLRFRSVSGRFSRHLLDYFVPVLFLIAGFFWAALRADILLQDALPEELEGKDLWLEGYIADLPKQAERGVSFKF